MAGELGFDTGPFVNMATFCEKVLQETDGVASIIRVVDQLNLTVQSPDAPDELPPGKVQTTLTVLLRAGAAKGNQIVKISIERPDGSREDSPEIAIGFPGGPGSGHHLVLPMEIQVASAGLYWADVIVNQRLMARVPLEITYRFVRGPAAGQ